MRARALPAFALAFLAVAGCLSGTSGPVTAKQVVGEATSLAHAWNKDAQLVVLGALEAKAMQADMAPAKDRAEIKALLPADDAKVDGKATEWHAMFVAGNKILVLVLDGAGHEAYRNETTTTTTGFKPLADWSIDSDQAMTAAQGNATFAKAAAASDLVILNLQDVGKGPVWFLAAAVSFQQSGTVMSVDAKSGAVSAAKSFISAATTSTPAELAQEKGRVSTPQMSPLTLVAPDATGSFEIKDGHGRINLTLSASTAGSANTIQATVKAPDGTETKLEAAGATSPSFPPGSAAALPKTTLQAPQAGTYTVSFHLTGGLTQTGRLDWCTDGKPAGSTGGGGGGRGGGGANTAC